MMDGQASNLKDYFRMPVQYLCLDCGLFTTDPHTKHREWCPFVKRNGQPTITDEVARLRRQVEAQAEALAHWRRESDKDAETIRELKRTIAELRRSWW